MKALSEIPISVLDLSPIRQGGTATESFRNTLDLARHAERLGYKRFWVAEHHSLPGIASAATSVVIGHVAGGTSRIRVMIPRESYAEWHDPETPVERLVAMLGPYPAELMRMTAPSTAVNSPKNDGPECLEAA